MQPRLQPGTDRKNVRDYPSFSLNAGRIAFPGQVVETGYHGASHYIRGEPVDLIFDSDFSRFDRQSGVYSCQVPTSFRGKRIDAIQLSACSLDINNPNSNPSEDSGVAPGGSDAKEKSGGTGDLAGGSGIMPVPPRLYMERMVSYSTGSSQYLRPIFDGELRLHNRVDRVAGYIKFPKEYILFRVLSSSNSMTYLQCVEAAPGSSTLTATNHGLTDYDIKHRLEKVIHGLPATADSIPSSAFPPKRAFGDISKFQTLVFEGTLPENVIVALKVRPFQGYAEVSARVNEALKGTQYIPLYDANASNPTITPLNGTDTKLYLNYSVEASGLFTVGPPDVVYIPDGQGFNGRGMCGLTVCQALGLQAGTDGKDLTPPPQIVRRDVVTIAEGAAPIAYGLQSGQHLANAVREAYSRLDPRFDVSGTAPAFAVMTAAGARIRAVMGTEPFRDIRQVCEHVQRGLGGSGQWNLTSQTNSTTSKTAVTVSTTNDTLFQVLGSPITVPSGSVAPATTVSTLAGLRMIGFMDGIVPANGTGAATAAFCSTTARGIPILNAPDPRFGIVHMFQPDRELRESTVGTVSGRPPIPVSQAIQHNASNHLSFYELQFAMSHSGSTVTGVSHPFHEGDLLEAFESDGKLISGTRFLVVDESDVCKVLPLHRTSNLVSRIHFVRRITFDDERLYGDSVTMTQTTNVFVHEHDMGAPGPDSADVPQPVVAFGTRRLGDISQLGVNVAMNRSPNMHRHSCSPDVDVVYVRLVHSNIYTNKVPSLPSEVGRASGILGRISHHNSNLAMDRSQSGSASFPGGTRLPSELQFQFLDQSGQVIRSGLKKWSLTCTIPSQTLNLGRA